MTDSREEALEAALREAYPYVNGVALDSSNAPWRIETAQGVLARMKAALSYERAADAEDTHGRADRAQAVREQTLEHQRLK